MAILSVDQQHMAVAERRVQLGQTEDHLVAIGSRDTNELGHFASPQWLVRRRAGTPQKLGKCNAFPQARLLIMHTRRDAAAWQIRQIVFGERGGGSSSDQ